METSYEAMYQAMGGTGYVGTHPSASLPPVAVAIGIASSEYNNWVRAFLHEPELYNVIYPVQKCEGIMTNTLPKFETMACILLYPAAGAQAPPAAHLRIQRNRRGSQCGQWQVRGYGCVGGHQHVRRF